MREGTVTVSKKKKEIKIRSTKLSQQLLKEKKQAELLQKIQKVKNRMESHKAQYNNEKREYTPEEKRNYFDLKHLKKIYKEIELAHVLLKLGAEKKPGKGRWKIPGTGSLIYQDEMQTWKFVNGVHNGEKGFSGLSLVEKVLDLDESGALRWMNENFGTEITEDLKFDIEVAVQKASAGKKDYAPPSDNPQNINYVINYLTDERGLPLSLINKLVDEHKIYADYDKRCVFVSAASAEIRSTPSSSVEFKGTCSGGQKDVSGFSVMPELNANEKTGVLVEAAVDALSYNTLYPGRYVLSTNGSGMFELQYKATLELLQNDFNVVAAFDADLAGDTASQSIFNALYLRNRIVKKNPAIQVEEIDQAFLTGKIKLKVDESPHHLFDSSFKEKLPVFIRNPENKEEWIDTGELGYPEISFEVSSEIANGAIKPGKYNLRISENDYKAFRKELKFTRERPVYSKDWNDELKKLGSAYLKRYEKCAENNFEMVPELPEYLEKNRFPTQAIKFDINNNLYLEEERATNLLKINSNTIVAENKVSDIKEEKQINEGKGVFIEQSRQEIFNTLCLRYFMKNRSGLDTDYETIDNFIKDKVKFFISDSPHLNFIDKPWQDEQPILREENGQKVISGMIKPTVRAIFSENFGNIKEGPNPIKINQKTFFGINKFMDAMCDEYVLAENKAEFIKEKKLNFIKISQEGNSFEEVMGKGQLLVFQKDNKITSPSEAPEPMKRKM